LVSIDGGGEELVSIDGGGEELVSIDGGEELVSIDGGFPSAAEKRMFDISIVSLRVLKLRILD
jgi:hypothetical protein